jgi:hypothetical protein
MGELLYSTECFTIDELRALGRHALDILTRTGHGREMARHLLAVTLAQGAALHYAVQNGSAVRYLDPARAGIKDIDIWCFFAAGEWEFNPRWKQNDDYGPSRFGRSPEDPGYLGRRIDVFGRSIPVQRGEQVDDSIRRWLQRPGKGSPYYLRQKAVVGLYPAPILGRSSGSILSWRRSPPRVVQVRWKRVSQSRWLSLLPCGRRTVRRPVRLAK